MDPGFVRETRKPFQVVVEGVEEEDDQISISRRKLTLQLADDDRVLLECDDGDEDPVCVVDDAEFSYLGRGRPGLRIGLVEIAPHLGLLPGQLIDVSIDHDLVRDPGRAVHL